MEEKAVELADRFWSYQNLRMGRTLEILPVRSSEEKSWMPLGHLILTNFDDANDPDGIFRDAPRRQQLTSSQ